MSTRGHPSVRSLWTDAFRCKSVWLRGARLGLPVGLVQVVVNQGDIWMTHAATSGTVVKSALSPLITFTVALVSAAATHVERQKSIHNP